MAKTIDELKAAAAVVRDATEEHENTALRIGQLLLDAFETLGDVRGNAIKGYVAIGSVDDLPESPTAEQQQKGWLLGTVLYVWVGTGGDTLEGKYQSAQLKGADGAPGEKGDKGDNGVHLGDVALVNDLTTGGEESALTAEMGKELGNMIKGMSSSREIKIMRKNIDFVNNRINGLIDSLANIAFVGERPALNQLDWSTKFFVTLPSGDVVCTDIHGDIISGDIRLDDDGSESLEVFLSAEEGKSVYNVKVIMGNEDVTEVCYNESSGKVYIESVIDDVVISAIALSINTLYKGIRTTYNDGTLRFGPMSNYVAGPLIDTGDRTDTLHITVATEYPSRDCELGLYDSNGVYLTGYMLHYASRDLNINPEWRFIRIIMLSTDAINGTSIYDNDSQRYLFKGSEHSVNEILPWKEFIKNYYPSWVRIGGGYLNTTIEATLLYSTVIKRDAQALESCCSQWFDLPSTGRARNIIFFIGGATTGQIRVRSTDNSSSDYFVSGALERTVSINAVYTCCAVLAPNEELLELSYVKYGDDYLWKGKNVE